MKPESLWKWDRPFFWFGLFWGFCLFLLFGRFSVCKVIAETVFHARLWPV